VRRTYRGASLIRNSPPPEDYHRVAVSYERGTPVGDAPGALLLEQSGLEEREQLAGAASGLQRRRRRPLCHHPG